jgi:Mg-chelatase subunit ChlD
MSLLMPLYIAGLAAISLPLIFHLIRRSPRGQVVFSSLMFLSRSPPRLTRRSRLDQWLLLLLRALALLLLAIAFARPFLRSQSALGITSSQGRRMILLVDTSASMQRQGAWSAAIERSRAVLDDLSPRDWVALYTFDNDVRVVVDFPREAAIPLSQHRQQISEQLGQLSPSWQSTNMAQALSRAAEDLKVLADESQSSVSAPLQIVLVSDMQQGSQVEALSGYEWPKSVKLDIVRVAPQADGNASLSLVADTSLMNRQKNVRLKISNSKDSLSESFHVSWVSADGTSAAGSDIYVPPGESRVIRVPEQTGENLAYLQLEGDPHGFDNRLFLAPTRTETVGLLYLGNDQADDTEGALYYLLRAYADSELRKYVIVEEIPAGGLSADGVARISLAIATRPLEEREGVLMRRYLEKGGHLLYVASDTRCRDSIRSLLGDDQLELVEQQPEDYAMLVDIDFDHPLFAPFQNPQFSSFNKIHFWQYREIQLPADHASRVLARFDNGHPALLEQQVGDGVVWILTSSWQPADSELARSTKFVPLLLEMLEASHQQILQLPQYEVGQAVALNREAGGGGDLVVETPEGSQLKIGQAETFFTSTSTPGIYQLRSDNDAVDFAVNLPPVEGDTAVMEETRLEQFGITLGEQQTAEQQDQRERQMRDIELESKQKLWQWLISGALLLLIMETWLAGRLTVKRTKDEGDDA